MSAETFTADRGNQNPKSVSHPEARGRAMRICKGQRVGKKKQASDKNKRNIEVY